MDHFSVSWVPRRPSYSVVSGGYIINFGWIELVVIEPILLRVRIVPACSS